MVKIGSAKRFAAQLGGVYLINRGKKTQIFVGSHPTP
jgi:hypothetical protein